MSQTIPDAREVKTICRMCHGGCGAIVDLVDNEPVKLRGDPDNPTSEGYFCIKGKASLDLLRSERRLRNPLVRSGPRGRGEFRPTTWDDAMTRVATSLAETMRSGRPEAIALCQGTDRNYQEWVFRLANAIGTPNVVGPAHVCFYPRVMASILTFGAFTFCDYDGDPEVILLWGSNKPNTHSDGVIGIKLLRALERGSRLITIDPKRTQTADRSAVHLPIRPGTDCALALGMINLVITENWYDQDFVEQHTSGFDELAEHVRAYDLDMVATVTGLDSAVILEVTREYALAARACIEAGTGLSQNSNSFDTHRCIAVLSALCGHLDAPGGDLIWDPMPIDGRRTFPRSDLLPPEQEAKRIGGDKHKVLSMSGWVAPGDMCTAILTQSPYPVSSMVIFGSNIVSSHEDSQAVMDALLKLDLVVVCDMFMTPTAQYADVVLPTSSWLERDQIVEFNSYIAARRKVATVPGCRSDEEIVLDLADRLGLAEHFFGSVHAALDSKLAGIGLSWDQFKEIGYIPNERKVLKYRTRGFNTRSGRVNLANPALLAMGYQKFPVFKPPPTPTAEHPLIMTSGHPRRFYNTEYHQLPVTSRGQTAPRVSIHPTTAEREGVSDGDDVELFSNSSTASVRMKAKVTTEVQPGVVTVDTGWWFPDAPTVDAALIANVNLLTSRDRSDEHMGSAEMRGIPVAIRRCQAACRTDGPEYG